MTDNGLTALTLQSSPGTTARAIFNRNLDALRKFIGVQLAQSLAQSFNKRLASS